ncbi:MAG: discoidin domain-containing protein [Mariniphaga sp.]
MHKKILVISLFLTMLAVTVISGSAENRYTKKSVSIDFDSPGRMFEGIGTVSAGASTRLLVDYPEPYRSNILDFLFKPSFGAGFTYLKVEIGGDGNSTCGSEPSFARTREELTSPNYLRGYEYWLMKEARKRNNKIELDALEWCMPGWFTNNKVWSQDNADYIAGFIKGARDFWKLDMTYIAGSWNERNYDRDWIVNVHRRTLNRSGFQGIKIVGPEGCVLSDTYEKLLIDDQLKKTICAVSEHYLVSYMFNDGSPDSARISSAIKSGIPIWTGEDFSLPGKPWDYTLYMAKNIIKGYLKQKAVKVNVWCPIASMADNSCFSNTGIMKAAEPWSGYYEVWPAIWGIAHFNQFVKPGWFFVESGCGTLEGDGVYATYKKPGENKDFSIVIVTGSRCQNLRFNYKGMPGGTLHVWRSDANDQFIQVKDIQPVKGSFSFQADPGTIYSITTTTSQTKGFYPVPERKSFTTDYFEDFESYSLSEAPLTAKYIWDNSGSFEIVGDGGGNKCLRQMVNNALIGWIPDNCAQTFVAQGREWENGEISSDVLVEENAFDGLGYGGIMIRGSYDRHGQADIPFGYRLCVYYDGKWKLLTKTKTLAEGEISVKGWHNLRLAIKGKDIKAYIDKKLMAEVSDDSYSLGAAGLVSGWNHSKFDNLRISFTPPQGVLISEWKTASASSESGNRFETARQAFDGNSLSAWKAGGIKTPQWLQVDLGSQHDLVRIETFVDSTQKVNKYRIDYSADGKKWIVYADNTGNTVSRIPCYIDEKEAKARYVRLTFGETDGTTPCVYAFNVFGKN